LARQRPPHGAGFDGLAGRIADQRNGFRLTKSVSENEPPGIAHAIDHFGVQRLAGACDLA
jgi:hypothetical protein